MEDGKGRFINASKFAALEFVKFVLKAAFAVLGAVFLSKLATINIAVLAPVRVYLYILVGTGVTWFCLSAYLTSSRVRPLFPPLDFDYEIKTHELTYNYLDRTHMLYEKKKQLRALRNGLDLYRDKYHWTGRGAVTITSGIREHEVRQTIRKNVWQFYEIQMQKVLRRGETVVTNVIWNLEDNEGIAVPFFSATIEEPTESLIFRLAVSTELGIKNVVCEISSGIGASKPFSSDERPLDRWGKLEWSVDKPKLLHHYEIRWKQVNPS